MSFLKVFLKDDSGTTLIEYGQVVAILSIAAVISFLIMGGQLQIIFGTVSDDLSSASADGGNGNGNGNGTGNGGGNGNGNGNGGSGGGGGNGGNNNGGGNGNGS